ncbi:MAG: tyrosine-type recombinase/integrase [Proteobacteria bacterium]|nr:tyrosine-type recombinase/integrase [Pseudomonadota bacterium]
MSYIDSDQGKKYYEAYLKKFKGKSSGKVYKSEIRQFFDFYPGELSGLSRAVLIKYRDHLGQSSKAKTVKRKFSMINQFFKFLEQKEKGFQSPIGQNYGDMQVFQGGVYADSEAFHHQLDFWMESLNRDTTRKTYKGHVRLFFEWMKKDPKDLNHDDFLRYRDHLIKEKDLKSSTIWSKFIAINGYLKFLASKSRKFKNPLTFHNLKLIPPKKDKGYYSILSEKEAMALLRKPDKRTLIGKRDHAILRLMLTYGLRVNEIARLRFRDIETERVNGQQKIWIRDRKGKQGNRVDTAIILNSKVLLAFDEWLESCGIHFQPDTPVFAGFIWSMALGGLVINQRRVREKNQLTVKAIENIIAKYVLMAGLDHGDRVISPHALRHTALTMLAKSGIDLIDLKYTAGHQNVNTTMIYLHSVQSYTDHVGMHNPINN